MSTKKNLVFIVFALVIFVILYWINMPKTEPTINTPNAEVSTVEIGGQQVVVELARTFTERSQGLSGREPLPENHGMLFVFDQAGRYGFWMNEMKFAIDIIWINENEIVDIWPRAPIPAADNIPSYTPKAEANYVLEVNAGFVDANGVKVGDLVSIDIN